ncbi:11755_t:CDS:1 [Paraglomus brasilianum]|uniref:11755_t:CDS:1 n=1 Tax=Paraglomus brasilianum TaxID=144538 RepID=A0A9N9C439_9GLOM|nr:11755_t:CDS:1 [Paraglomus brasilianum]
MTTIRVFTLAIQHCRRLQTLNFNTEKSPACSQLNSCLSSVQSLPYLRNFTWRSRRSYRQVFDSLSKVAQNMESVTLHGNYGSLYRKHLWHSLIRLIESLQQLKSFKILHTSWNMDLVLRLLKGHLNTLESITFKASKSRNRNSFVETVEIQLKNTAIRKCYYNSRLFNNNDLKQFAYVRWPNLQEIVFSELDFLPEILTTLIHNHGKTLTSMEIGKVAITSKICKSILQNCTSLTHLSIVISQQLVMRVAYMIAKLSNLHSITLSWETYSFRDIDVLFNNLANHELPHLYKLQMVSGDRFQVDSLQNFLSNSRPPLQTLCINSRGSVTDEHLNVILDYLGDTLKKLKLNYDVNVVSKACMERVLRVVEVFDKKFYD